MWSHIRGFGEWLEKDKKCPFVTPEGCTVYDDRPWPCRMYPMDMNDDGTFSLITDSSRCKGLNEDDKRKICDWLENQGIAPYDEMNEHFSSLTIQRQDQIIILEILQCMDACPAVFKRGGYNFRLP